MIMNLDTITVDDVKSLGDSLQDGTALVDQTRLQILSSFFPDLEEALLVAINDLLGEWPSRSCRPKQNGFIAQRSALQAAL